jgi:hypothetical protein
VISLPFITGLLGPGLAAPRPNGFFDTMEKPIRCEQLHDAGSFERFLRPDRL